jgi:hypothetical protein
MHEDWGSFMGALHVQFDHKAGKLRRKKCPFVISGRESKITQLHLADATARTF